MHGIANDIASGLTQSRLCEVLRYDRDTGAFFWIKSTSKKKLVGKIAGNITRGYWEIAIDGRQYKAHRLAWLYELGRWPVKDIDHINGERADNRFLNLREATRSQNCMNRGYRRGVAWHSQMGKWRAYITIKGRQKSLGLFDKKDEAFAARKIAEIKLYGEFARAA